MTPLIQDEIRALRELVRLWTPEFTILVGASALRCFIEMSWRTTADLDLSVAASIKDASTALATLPGWSPHPKYEQRWLTDRGIAVDIVPAGPEALARGYIVWPRSGLRMSLLGMRLAFDHAAGRILADDLVVRVAPLPVLALLKMISYLDRPHEREKDLGDLAHVLHGYVAIESDRRYSEEVSDNITEYDDVAPFLLGRDLRTLINKVERQGVMDFLAAIGDEYQGPRLRQKISNLGPSAWRDPEAVLQRFAAFRQGLGT